MRGGVKLAAALVAALTVGIVGGGASGVANTCTLVESSACPPRPTLVVKLGATVKPARLPKAELRPVTITAEGSLRSAIPSHAPALREAVIEIDRQVTLDAEGLPGCEAGRLVHLGSGEARHACRGAIIGGGTARVVLAPDGRAVDVPLTFFNGGVRDGTTTLLVHSPSIAGARDSLLATVKVSKRPKERFGSQVIVRVPPIAGGKGSLDSFRAELGRRFAHEGEKRSYLASRCRRSPLEARFTRLLLRNEVGTPGLAPRTELVGTAFAPCTPTG